MSKNPTPEIHKAYQATPNATLEEQIVSYNVPKNEREWWACHEIHKLRDKLRANEERDAQLTVPEQHEDLLKRLRENVDYGGYDGFGPDDLHIAAANAIEQLLARVRETEVALLSDTDELPPEHFSEVSRRNWFIGYWREKTKQAEARLAAKQAEVDRLMLEYCPYEMTVEQIENWIQHQQPVSPEAEGHFDANQWKETKG